MHRRHRGSQTAAATRYRFKTVSCSGTFKRPTRTRLRLILHSRRPSLLLIRPEFLCRAVQVAGEKIGGGLFRAAGGRSEALRPRCSAGWEGARPLIWLFSLGCKPLGEEGVYEFSHSLLFPFPFIFHAKQTEHDSTLASWALRDTYKGDDFERAFRPYHIGTHVSVSSLE
eukprot:COSAG02_NODE_28034_length_597_cov_1.646586_1_plen_169_part_10